MFPTYGLIGATVGMVLLAFFIPYLSVVQLAWAFGGVALFMGTVMGVVQVTVQCGFRTAAAGHRRRHGAILALGRRRFRYSDGFCGVCFPFSPRPTATPRVCSA